MTHILYNSKLEEALTRLQCELVAERNRVNTENISWFQYDILESLYISNGALPATLSINLGVTRSKLSKGLKGLKEKGYIKQEKSKEDARELRTDLTQKGIDFLIEIKKGHEHLADIAESVLTTKEKENLLISSIKLSDALAKRRLQNEL